MYETYALAGIGAAGGVWKYYIKPELTAKRAWMGLGALVMAYEMSAPPGELLSEGVDKALLKYPLTTKLAVGITALHLMNALPEKIDPYHQLFKLLGLAIGDLKDSDNCSDSYS